MSVMPDGPVRSIRGHYYYYYYYYYKMATFIGQKGLFNMVHCALSIFFLYSRLTLVPGDTSCVHLCWGGG